VIDERLDEIDVKWDDNAAVCIVAVSGGYPLKYNTGFEIKGIENAEKVPGVIVFHAGTRYNGGKYYTAGGRVLGVTAVSDTLEDAIIKAYEGVNKINFMDIHYRKDIGRK
jgi:phosphoribosylamine--glycine ligase